jgi:hypothetical protein
MKTIFYNNNVQRPGRPKLVRIGAPRRPKKVHNEILEEEANNTDFVLTC